MDAINYTIMVVKEMKDEWHKKPHTCFMKGNDFDIMSYTRWACDEIILELEEHTLMHPIDILDNFKYRCGIMASNTTSEEFYFMLTIVQDVVMDVLDIIRGMI